MTTLEERLRAEMNAAVQEHDAREKRRKQVRAAQHSGDMEGLPRSAESDLMMQAYVEGTMTTADMKAQLDTKYRR